MEALAKVLSLHHVQSLQVDHLLDWEGGENFDLISGRKIWQILLNLKIPSKGVNRLGKPAKDYIIYIYLNSLKQKLYFYSDSGLFGLPSARQASVRSEGTSKTGFEFHFSKTNSLLFYSSSAGHNSKVGSSPSYLNTAGEMKEQIQL